MIFKCFPMQPEKTMKIWKRGSAAFPTDIPKEILEEFHLFFWRREKPVGKEQMDHVNKKIMIRNPV